MYGSKLGTTRPEKSAQRPHARRESGAVRQDFSTSGKIRWIQPGSNTGKPHADVVALGQQPKSCDEDRDGLRIGVTADERSEAVVVVKIYPTAAVPQRKRMVIEIGHQGQKFQPINEAGVTEKVQPDSWHPSGTQSVEGRCPGLAIET